MANKTAKKKQVKIPVRILSQSEPLDFKEALVEEESVAKKPAKPVSTKPTSKKAGENKAKIVPNRKDLEQRKKKALIWTIIIMVVIVAGWLVFTRGVFSNITINTSTVKGVGDELTDTFEDFDRIYSNARNINGTESSDNGRIEDLEDKVFPQFKENK